MKNNEEYFKVMIFGRPGSGKSTFSLKLSAKLDIPLFHLDKYFFIENWVERDHLEFIHIQHSLVNNEKWIIDGNSTSTLEIRYQNADICIYFHYSRFICLINLIKRRLFKDKKIDDRAEGCQERLRWVLIRYMWSFEDRVKEKIKRLREKYPYVKFVEIRNRKDAQRVFDELTQRENSQI